MTGLPENLASALADRYRLERHVGEGGMASVYLAEDLKHHRRVAIKIVRPDLSAALGAERFLREIETTASLRHPHILPLYDSGSIGGGDAGPESLYYVMPFVEGESLRDRLEREKQLPLDDALQIAREVADALGYAHSRGVVHRDIKPENILLESDHAVVADFGIAKAISAAGGDNLTQAGMAVGTPSYMSPEQAAAKQDLDGRSDLYALGCVLYEMLAGQPPFTGPTTESVVHQHLASDPAPVTQFRPAVPAEVASVLPRLLAKAPADRFRTASAFIDALKSPHVTGAISGAVPVRRPPGVAAVAGLYTAGALGVFGIAWALMLALGLPDWVLPAAAGLLVVGLPIMLRAAHRAGNPAAAPSARLGTLRGGLVGGALAFLGLALVVGTFMTLRALGIGPFATLLSAGTLSERDPVLVAEFTNTTGDSVLGASLTEALTVDLSQSSVLRFLPPREISDALQRMQRDPNAPLTRDVALELATREGLKAVVAGEVSSFAGGYLLTARVLAPDGTTLYATRATAGGAADILDALQQLSHDLRGGIGESFRSIRDTPGLEQVTTASLEALRLYTRASRDWSEGSRDGSSSLLRQAIALDSNFAMAWRRLSGNINNMNGDPAEIFAAAERAYDLRDRLPQREALLASASYHEWTGAYDEVIRTYEQVLASWPDDRSARNNLGLLLRVVGRYADAERLLRPPVDSAIAPASTYYNLVVTLIPQEKFDDAQQVIDLLAERLPESPTRWQLGAYLALAQNRFDVARSFADSALQGGPAYRYWGHLYAVDADLTRGRLRSARTSFRAAAAVQREYGSPGNALQVGVAEARADLLFGRDTAGAARALEALLAATPLDSLDALSRPYGDVIRLYVELGRLDQARQIRESFFRALPEGMRGGSGSGLRGLAVLAAAEGRHAEAIDLANRAARVAGCDGCMGNELGASFEALGEPDSAIAAYERVLRPPTYGSDFKYWRPIELPIAYLRAARLLEARGNRQLALERYSAFVDLWQQADPELQPRVDSARARIRALSGT